MSFPDWAFTPGQEKGPNATPIVREGKLFVLGSLSHLLCLGAVKGEVFWKKDLAQEYQFDPLPATSASPLIDVLVNMRWKALAIFTRLSQIIQAGKNQLVNELDFE